MNNITVKAKQFTREYLKEHSHIVFKNRELIIEADGDSTTDHTVYRYKIGDGVSPYSALKYISSLYSVFPEVIFYDNEYENSIKIKFEE